MSKVKKEYKYDESKAFFPSWDERKTFARTLTSSLNKCYVVVYVLRGAIVSITRFYSYSDSYSESDSGMCNSPFTYRQPSGNNGQSLSRRYCTQSWCLFLRAP